MNVRLTDNEYIAGSEFSIADMAAFPWLWKYPKQLGIDMTALQNLERWRAAMEMRPGFERIRDTIRSLIKRGTQKQASPDADALDRFYRRGR